MLRSAAQRRIATIFRRLGRSLLATRRTDGRTFLSLEVGHEMEATTVAIVDAANEMRRLLAFLTKHRASDLHI
jgi:hypothetical protein